MKKRVILVHGFNVFDNGKNTIDRLGPYFKQFGYKVVQMDYGWVFLLGVRFFTHRHVKKLQKLIKPGDLIVGHSNGCNIINKVLWKKAPVEHVVYINPALNKDAPLAPQVKMVHVWHSDSDSPVRFATYLWHHPWGEMGSKGYKGCDKRYVNFNKEKDFELSSSEHSDVFLVENLKYFGPLITGYIDHETKS